MVDIDSDNGISPARPDCRLHHEGKHIRCFEHAQDEVQRCRAYERAWGWYTLCAEKACEALLCAKGEVRQRPGKVEQLRELDLPLPGERMFLAADNGVFRTDKRFLYEVAVVGVTGYFRTNQIDLSAAEHLPQILV